ncbi:ornithine carbamoyltransferase [Bacillus shivajii]|nr:ornithine carbamoyltransferase [Bacillus shivajii]UCZ55419.1 ornithine carbamoyltransferase [Bacillus shivajii]
MRGKHFLTLADFNSYEIEYLLKVASQLKRKQQLNIPHEYLKGKTLGMIFEKSSTRTRLSFEIGMLKLGGHASFLSSNDLQIGRGESISDTAKVLSRYLDGVMIRTYSHETIEEFAEASSIPVINGLTDSHHPAQVLADLLTIKEHKGQLKGLKLCYVGDGNNNMTHSLLEGAAKTGMNMTVSSPEGYEPDKGIYEKAKDLAERQGCSFHFTYEPEEAAEDADVIVTDVWASMGEEHEQEERVKKLTPYQVNESLCDKAKDDFLFLHCLPAHRGEEVTAEIIDGKHSVVFDEAENRLHAQKALLKVLMGD